ncbi:MAG: competence/damage-inducible protein A, partial [Oscillospiraceae bacterium]
MKAEIISVGNELLMGDTANTNTTYLARNLSQMGFNVHRHSVIGDIENDITDATKRSISRSHVIIFTGGLGPTKDDLTKETVAKALRLRLVKSQAVEDEIRKFFDQKGLQMTENNLKQAMVVEGGKILKNENGTAPGIFIQSKNQVIALLPGPPCELEPMFEKELRPRLEKFADIHAAHISLHLFGIGESELETKIKDLLYASNPHAALYAKTGEVQIVVTALAKTVQGANKLLESHVEKLKERLGEYIYSSDGSEMNETVVHLLDKSNVRISVAESCTGGLMAAGITAVSGASKIFELGYSSYSDRAKEQCLAIDSSIVRKYSSVSSVVAAEMAKGALLKAKSGIGVGITGIAGPTNEGFIDKPVGLVYIAVADKNKVLVKKFNFGNMRSRDNIRQLCVLNAFDMVRRFITGLPIENVKQFSSKDLADLEREGKPKKKSSVMVEKGIVSALCAVVIMAGAFFTVGAIRAKVEENIYANLQSTFSTAAASNRLTSLVERNPDTVGWLSADGTTLDSVVVQNREDGFYDNHDFEGSKNKIGCPNIPFGVDAAAAQNVVVYGRPSDSSQLFGNTRSYSEPSMVQSKSLISYESIYGTAQYKMASVYIANTNNMLGNTQT